MSNELGIQPANPAADTAKIGLELAGTLLHRVHCVERALSAALSLLVDAGKYEDADQIIKISLGEQP